MLKFQKKLVHFNDCFKNQIPIIVGSGPTNFDYKDLDKYKNPIFFINNSVFLGDKKGRYFFTHHPDIERWLNLKSTYLFMENRNNEIFTNKKPNGPYVPINLKTVRMKYEKDRFLNYEDMPHWTLNKKYIIKNNVLFSHWGSITTLIHFLWFTGAKKVIGIGVSKNSRNCNHDTRIPLNYDVEQKEYIGKCKGLEEIIHNQKVCLDFFNINMEYYL